MPFPGPGLHAHPTAGSANPGGSSRLLSVPWLPLTTFLVPLAGTWHGSKNRGGLRPFLPLPGVCPLLTPSLPDSVRLAIGWHMQDRDTG